MATALETKKLYFHSGASNKEYWVTVGKDKAGNWLTIGSWGRSGRVSQHKVYVTTPNPITALLRANELLNDKMVRGYRGPARQRLGNFIPNDFIGERRKAKPLSPKLIDHVPVVSLGDALFG
jgi:predicted DNA-binding WGR domain protein